MKIYSWRFIQEIFLFIKMNSWRFVLWKLKCRRFIHCWRFDHGDLSFEDLFRRFFLLWRCVHEDLSIEDWSVGDLSLFEDFSFLKNVLGDLSFWNFVRRFFPLKIEVQEIFPLLISCKKNKSWFLVK